MGAPGQQYWDLAEAEVTQTIRGSTPSPISVSYTVQVMPPFAAEAAPIPGEDLILFVTGDGKRHRILKMLPATRENIASVTAISGP